MGKKSAQKKNRPEKLAAAVSPPPAPELPAVPPSPLAGWIWGLAAVLAFWAFGFTTMRGSDLYWHLAAGDWMAEHGGFLATDPWSFTREGQPWLNDAWLSDRIYHYWVRFFGLESLVWWKWGVLFATFLLLMKTLRRLTADTAASYVGAVFAIAVAEAFLDIRPQLFSLLGYSVLLHLTVARPRPSPWLPLLFLIWVQLHAIFVFGLMALGVLLAPSLLWGKPAERRYAIVLGVACALVCLLNPNFITVFTRPLRYALDSSSPFRTIGEWQPPFERDGIYSPYYPYAIGIFIAAVSIVVLRRWGLESARSKPYLGLALTAMALVGLAVRHSIEIQRITPEHTIYDLAIKLSLGVVLLSLWADRSRDRSNLSYSGVALGALTLAMSLRSRRFVPLFAMSQALVLAPALAPLCRALGRRLAAVLPDARHAALAGPVLAVALGTWWLRPYPLDSRAFHYLMAEDTFPIETLNFIEQNRISGNIFSYYNWGGYLHLRTQGALKVYIDGRADMVFDDDTYRNYVRVLGLQPGWKEIVEGSGAPYVLWPKNDPRLLQQLLRSGDWRMLYEDAVSGLLVRSRAPALPDLKPTPDSAWRDLALGSIAASRNQLPVATEHYRRALERMPHLSLACYELARLAAVQGDIPAARERVAHCQQIFPYPGKTKWFEKYLARLEQKS